MEHSQLERPPDRLILSDQSDSEEIANCLELHRNREDLVCATHTSSQRHAPDLPSRASVVIADLLYRRFRLWVKPSLITSAFCLALPTLLLAWK